jgi:hypothetical protein
MTVRMTGSRENDDQCREREARCAPPAGRRRGLMPGPSGCRFRESGLDIPAPGCFAPHYCLLKFCALITVQKSEDEDKEKNEEDEEDE